MTSSKTLKLACAAFATLLCLSAVAALRGPAMPAPAVVVATPASQVTSQDEPSQATAGTANVARVVVTGRRMTDQEKATYDAQLRG